MQKRRKMKRCEEREIEGLEKRRTAMKRELSYFVFEALIGKARIIVIVHSLKI